MSSDDTAADPVREFLLGVAAQIDQLAALFSGAGPRSAAATGTGPHTATGPAAAPGTASGAAAPEAPNLATLTGEITSLLAEIGDLLARLIAALIAILEAIAAALRSAPAAGAAAAPHYQAIAVRIDPPGDPRAARPQRSTEPEGEN